uniref:Reverse transcriptase domain-containing protein n=1 Tax=Haemonchus contortus TaxID=6289 RepID=A0A7I5EED8_HAECO
METGTTQGPNKISADLLRAGGYKLQALLAAHMTYLQKKIPNLWRNSRMDILYKKGDRDDLCNYRPIGLLGVLYKLFTNIILIRLSRTLVEAQPVEQAGFRREIRCLDHIQAVAVVIEQTVQTKTQFMKNAWADEGQVKIDGTPIKETSSYVYLGRSMDMENDMREELVKRQKAAWAAFGPLK